MRTGIRSRLLIVFGIVLALLLPTGAAHADVDDFSYASWTSEYLVSIDDRGRSQVHVTETLIARFPDHDQNRGIVRGLAERYEGAGLGLRIESVTDENGDRVPYDTESDDGTLYLLLGDDDFVHGLTTYVIRYTMRDAILAATESGNDEFYWNLLPLDSRQRIERFEGHVTLSTDLSAHLTGDVACYEGFRGATQRCEMTREDLDGGATTFTVTVTDLAPGYGVTPAIGLTSGTVTQPAAREFPPALDAAPIVMLGGAAATTVGGFFAASAFRRKKRAATGIVIAQYDVPDDLPPLLAATVYHGARDALPAQIVHLAVRGVLRIESGAKQPTLRLLDPAKTADPLDDKMLRILFPGGEPGEIRTLPRSSTKFARTLSALSDKTRTHDAPARGLLTKERSRVARALVWAVIALTAISVAFAAVGAVVGREDAGDILVTVLIGGVFLTLITVGNAQAKLVHTATGAETAEYLAGVREFIRVAEADRLRMLQSATGAERYSEGSAEVVHLYERLLPYAMLFGEEKSWGRVLETQYAASDLDPHWIHGYTAASLSSQLSSFTSSARSSTTYTSSSSGGSSGGGFSGGGGGGGFSGGR